MWTRRTGDHRHGDGRRPAEKATGKQYVKFWLHGAFLNIEGEKIAKSVGNTSYLKDLEIQGVTPLAYRYWLLTAHYLSQIDFTW